MSSAKNYENLLKDYEQAQAQLARTQLREKAAKKSLKDADKKDASKTVMEVMRLELDIAKAKRKVRKAEATIAKIHIKQWIKANAKNEKSYKLTIYEEEETITTIAAPIEDASSKRKYTKRGAESNDTRAIDSPSDLVEGKAGVSNAQEDANQSLLAEGEEPKKERKKRISKQEAAANRAAAQAALKESGDDFTIIEGIGPAVTKLLHSVDIKTFGALAAANADDLKALLKSRRNNIAEPATWPQQAQMVVDNDYEGLKQLQESIKRPRS